VTSYKHGLFRIM